MDVKILDSIIHGSLKPWKIDNINKKRWLDFVKGTKGIVPKTYNELRLQLSSLLADFPIQQHIINNDISNNTQLIPFKYLVELPQYIDPETNYYYIIITRESLRIFNSLLLQSKSWSERVDIHYHVNQTLTNIKVLTKQTIVELNEQGFSKHPNLQRDQCQLILYYLKHTLVQLYFNIQDHFKTNLGYFTSLEDYFLLDLESPLDDITILKSCAEILPSSTLNDDATQIELFILENSQIEKIEIALRKLIIDACEIKTISDYKQTVPSHIQEKIKTNIEKEQKKNPGLVKNKNNSPDYFLQFSDLQELQAILVTKTNWEKVQDLFGTKENLATEFNNLSGLRNPLRHSREVDRISLLKGQAAIQWFYQQLGLTN